MSSFPFFFFDSVSEYESLIAKLRSFAFNVFYWEMFVISYDFVGCFSIWLQNR